MNILKGVLIFGLGVASGFGACYIYYKKKFEKQAEDEISEVKSYYLQKSLKETEERKKRLEKIEDDSKKLNEVIEKIDYSKLNNREEEKMKAEAENPEEEEPTKPYMITEDEFLNDMNDYEKLSLTYFTVDDTLADDCDEMVDVEETISSDIYNQISESDDGDYYVRNPLLQVDYEIMKVDQSFKERYGFDY